MLTGTTPTPLPLDQMKPWNSARQMLVCTSVTDEAPDVKTFTFAVEGGGWFNYMPGQFITVELRAKGGDLHRTYTVSSSPSRPYAIAITIKAQPTSIGTRWMFENVRPGSRVRAYGPSGHFTLSRNPGKKYLFISAGSGITPMMSMLRWLSDCAPDTDVVFINSARRPEEIIFREELELLAKRMPNLSLGFLPEARSVASPWSELMGRIDRHKLSMLTPDFMGREIFCCGPDPFMRAVSAIVHAEGFDMGHYHQESFGATSIAKSVHKQAQEPATCWPAARDQRPQSRSRRDMERKASLQNLGTPEDMFLAWFFGLPDGADVGHAALSEIARIDGIAAPSVQLLSLRSLLHQATLNILQQPRRRRRQRH
nr:FAD-binding oxidoreductase [Sinorhizobium fredii]